MYEAISLALADDEDLLGLILKAPATEARPTLLLAAVHYLLLGGAEHPLARFFPSVSGRQEEPVEQGELVATFRSFCHGQRSPLVEIIESGHTQTNDVRRSAALVFALQELARTNEAPIGLIEVGASAGLNLLYERYGYRFGAKRLGDASGGVDIPVEMDEPTSSRVGPDLPPSASLVGIDVAPIDIFDDDATRWLRSFVWPELTEDADRLMAAMAMARTSPPDVRKGDGIGLLPALVDAVPDGVLPVVFHATLFTYLDRDDRLRFPALLDDLGAQRPLAWVALEAPVALALPGGLDPSGAAPAAGAAADRSTFALTLVTWWGGRRRVTTLARVDPYGRWMRTLRNGDDPA
jgi:hypothetical protein